MCKKFEDFDEEAKRYKEIILNYRDKGEVFVDKNFHPIAKIPEQEVSFNESSTEWRRIDEVYDVPLFKKELIQIDYVKQGTLGDCYFLSAIIQLSQQPFLIPFLFDRQVELYLGKVEDSINIKCGAVVIYFHAFGRKTPVLIDTLIPFVKGTNTPLFSQPSDTTKSPWFCLIEKAYAKLNGSYTEVVGGSFSQAIYSLYGYYSTTKKVSELQTAEKIAKMKPFDRLLKYQKQGAIMGAAIHPQYLTDTTEEELTNKGLITIHSYLILKLKQFGGQNFLCLRNPWGDHEWNGDWSDNSPLWTPEMKSNFGLKVCEDGTFWMADTDFFKYFTEIDISKPVHPDSHSRQFHYKMEPGTYDDESIETMDAFNQNLPRFAFQVIQDFNKKQKCRMHIICERRHKLTKEKIPPYCVEIKSRHSFTIRVFQMAGKSQYISFPYSVLNSSEILVIHLRRLGKCSVPEECYVRVFCDLDFRLIDVNKPEFEIPEDKKTNSVFDNFSLLKPIMNDSPNMAKDRNISKNRKAEPMKVDKQENAQKNSPLSSPMKNSNEQGQYNSPIKRSQSKPEKTSNYSNPPQDQPSKSSPNRQQQSKDNSNQSPIRSNSNQSPTRSNSNQSPTKPNSNQSPAKPNSNKSPMRSNSNQSPMRSNSNQPHNQNRPKTPQAHKSSPHQTPEKPIKTRPIQSPSNRPKINLIPADLPKDRNNLPRTEKTKRDKQIDRSKSMPFPPSHPKVVKAKPPETIDLNDDNIRKMYNSIRTNVLSSYLH